MRTMMSNMSLARLPKISKKKLTRNKKNKKQKIINNNNINFKKDNQNTLLKLNSILQ